MASHAAELEVLDRRAAGQLAEQQPHRMARVDVVGAVAHHQRNLGRSQVAGQERDQVASRRVGPVQVLDDHDQPRRALADSFEQRQRLLEDRCRMHLTAATATGEQRLQLRRPLAEQPVELLRTERPSQPLHDFEQWEEADADVIQIDTAADRRNPTCDLHAAAQLVDQAALADARIATDDDQLSLFSSGLDCMFEVTSDSRPTKVGHVTRFTTRPVWTNARAPLPPSPETVRRTRRRAHRAHPARHRKSRRRR